jgi:hypothetical protein
MNAFTQVPPRKKVHKAVRSIEVDLIKISNDAFPGQRSCPEGKYVEMFTKMKPGQCLECEPAEVQPLAAGMRKWLVNQGKDKQFMVRTMTRFPKDGRGRVWLIAKEAKLRQVA